MPGFTVDGRPDLGLLLPAAPRASIPYDPHLEEGAEIELEMLSSDTAEAYLALAAVVGDGLAWPRRLTSRSALP